MDALMTAASVGGGSGKRNLKLLWTNPNPSAEITDKTINLDLSKYNFVVIVFFNVDGGGNGYDQGTIIVQDSDYGNYIIADCILNTAYTGAMYRRVSAGIKGVKIKCINSTYAGQVIPFEIYGY